MEQLTKTQAYRIIAKHIYIAYLTHSTSRKEIIILADSDSEATELAKQYFPRSLITVKHIEQTKNKQIYEI